MKNFAAFLGSLVLSVAAFAAPVSVNMSASGVSLDTVTGNLASPSVSHSFADLTVSGKITPPGANLFRPQGDGTNFDATLTADFLATLTLTVGNDIFVLYELGSASCLVVIGQSSCAATFDLVEDEAFVKQLTGSEFDDFVNSNQAFTCGLKVIENGIPDSRTTAECTANVAYGPSTNVPEPGSLALMGLALAGLGVSARRRKAA